MSNLVPQPLANWWSSIFELTRPARADLLNRLQFLNRIWPVLPPGASTMQLAVPAFWPRESGEWARLASAGQAVSFAVVDGSWPETARNDVAWKSAAQAQLASVGQQIGSVLGYVSTRRADGSFKGNDEILGNVPGTVDPNHSVEAWYTEFGSQIDGIYFDELVIPQIATSVAEAHGLVAAFKAAHAGKVAILAGQCGDESIVTDPNVDWALLWEGHFTDSVSPRTPYADLFAPLLANGNRTEIPAWWKNPTHRHKIVHIVHNCQEPQRQGALGLGKERNAGHMFVMDRRGLRNPNDPGSDDLYDHLPPYWEREVTEVNSYYDFGLDPLRALRAATRYGATQTGMVHAWPNFEQAWYATGHVRGTYLLEAGPHAEIREVLLTDLAQPGQPAPSLYDIPGLWASAHAWTRALGQGFETALPTFEELQGGAATRLVLLRPAAWLVRTQVPIGAVYEQPAPTFAEPGAVVRNTNRVVTAVQGTRASFPTFEPDGSDRITGRSQHYNCYALRDPSQGAQAPVHWQDVPTSTYIAQL